MLHFMTGLYNTIFSEEEINILIIGHEGAGKTTLLEQLKYMYARETKYNQANYKEKNEKLKEPHLSKPKSYNNDSTNNNSINTPSYSNIPEVLLHKRVRPTIGVNLVRLTHQFAKKPQSIVGDNENKAREICSAHINAEARVKDVNAEVDTTKEHTAGNSNIHEKVRNCEREHYASGTTAPNPYAGRSEKTNLLLWDVGGARSLRSLWAPYFPQCHGVIYVIDSTLPFTMFDTNSNNLIINSNNHDIDSNVINEEIENVRCEGNVEKMLVHPQCTCDKTNDAINNNTNNNNNKQTNSKHSCSIQDNECKELSRYYSPVHLQHVYKDNRATLQRLLLHPELESVPFLVLSNKADNACHVSLSELQDALGVVDWALFDNFYNTHISENEINEEQENEEQYEEQSSSSSNDESNEQQEQWQEEHYKSNTTLVTPDTLYDKCDPRGTIKEKLPLSESTSTNSFIPKAIYNVKHENKYKKSSDSDIVHGRSGFGSITWKLAEISALTGFGVSSAMDWLIAQLVQHHRLVDENTLSSNGTAKK